MPVIIDENTTFNTDVGEVFPVPLRDAKIDDYFFYQIATQDNNEVFLIDDTDWTKDVSGSPSGGNVEILTWWKKITNDGEIPTGVENIGADNTWPNIMVIRGLDPTNPIDASDGTYLSSSALAICPSVPSSQANQIALRCVVSDGQNLTRPTSLMTVDYKTDAFWGFNKVDAESTGTLEVALAASDQWAASTIVLKRASGDTSAPIITSDGAGGFGTLTLKTGITHNGDDWRQEVFDSGKCLDYTGARETWTVDMAKTWTGGAKIVQVDNVSGGTFSIGNYLRFNTGLYRGEIVDIYDPVGATVYLYLRSPTGTTPVNNEGCTEYTDGTYGTPTGVTGLAQGGGLDGGIGVNDIRVSDLVTYGRMVYVTNMTDFGVSNGYYWLGPGEFGLNSATLGRYRRLYSDSSRFDTGVLETLSLEQTGTADITDVGMVIFDYTESGDYPYPTGGTGTTYWNANVVGNNRVFTSAEDLSAELMATFWKPASTSQIKYVYFWACDDAGAWKLWNLKPSTILLQDYFSIVDFDSTDTPIHSSGTFDATSVKYYAILYTSAGASNRYGLDTYNQYKLNDMVITGGSSTIPMEMWQIQKWLNKSYREIGVVFDEYIQEMAGAYTFANTLVLGDGSFASSVDIQQTYLATLPQANGIDPVQFNADANKIGIEVDKCGGDIRTDLIKSDSGLFFTETSADTIDYSGTSFVKTLPTLQAGKTYDSLSFVECYQIDLNGATLDACTIDNSLSTVAAVLLDDAGTIENTTIKNNDYGIEIDTAGDYTFDNLDFSGNTKDVNVTLVSGTVNIEVLNSFYTPTYITAGATVNLTVPEDKAEAKITSVLDGSRVQVYNVTDAVEVANEVVSGTEWSLLYDRETTFETGEEARVRVTYLGKERFTATAIANYDGWTLKAVQGEDTIYTVNAIDGSTVTEFSADYPNVEIDITDPDGTTTPQRIYAWWTYNETTEDGVANWFGGLLAEDALNYKVITSLLDLHLQNANVAAVVIISARIYRDDGASILTSGSGTIQMDPLKAYIAPEVVANTEAILVLTTDIEADTAAMLPLVTDIESDTDLIRKIQDGEKGLDEVGSKMFLKEAGVKTREWQLTTAGGNAIELAEGPPVNRGAGVAV